MKNIFLIILFNFLFSDEIYLINGSILKGQIIEKSENSVSINVKFSDSNQQTILVDISEIDRIVYDDSSHSDFDLEYLYKDPNKSRYFFVPSAFGIGSGNTYFRNTWVFFSSFGRGINNNLSVEGGISLFPGGGLDNQLKFFSLKFNSDNINFNDIRFAAGGFYLGSGEFAIGYIFGTVTQGGSDNNFSISSGLGYNREEDGINLANSLTIVVCGKKRISKSISLISENWIFFDSDIMLSNTGIRFFGKSLSADFSGIFDMSDLGIPMPMLSISYQF